MAVTSISYSAHSEAYFSGTFLLRERQGELSQQILLLTQLTVKRFKPSTTTSIKNETQIYLPLHQAQRLHVIPKDRWGSLAIGTLGVLCSRQQSTWSLQHIKASHSCSRSISVWFRTKTTKAQHVSLVYRLPLMTARILHLMVGEAFC